MQNILHNTAKRKLCLISRMMLVDDEVISCCIKSFWWQRNLQCWRNWVQYRGELNQTEIRNSLTLKKEDLENRLWKSEQGHWIVQVIESGFSCHWLWGKSAAIRGNKFTKAFKVISNNLPVKLNINRGKKGVNNTCRLWRKNWNAATYLANMC